MKNVVVIGGGTGTYMVLAALREHPVGLTAVVSMADDGGSTGVLRDQYGVLPPGDVRRALVALSGSSDALRDLFNYRFESGDLGGHSFGNLFLSALEKVTGDFSSALKEASEILAINGEVVPVTLDNVRLCARLADKKILRGETNIDIPKGKARAPVERVWLEPKARLNPAVRRVLKRADLIVIGPGDLYTSLVPNLLVSGMKEAIKRSPAVKVYVCNLMTKRGETGGFGAEDFVGEVEKYLGKGVLDYAVFNNKRPPEPVMRRYRREGASFVVPPRPRAKGRPSYVVTNLVDRGPFLRHGPRRKLAGVLLKLLEC